MVRTQIQLTEEQAATLRSLAAARHVSMAELIRMSIDGFVDRQALSAREDVVARAKAAVGRFSSGLANVSAEHDRYLADAFGDK
jgi:hypothetical protein